MFEDWIKSLLGIGEVAVVVGVMIEGLADGGIFLASGKLQMIQVSELEHMRLATAQANERAAEANERAAEANEKAEREHLELIRIERRFAPRKLSAKEKERISAKLAGFTARTITVIEARNDDPEVKDFVIDLLHIFNDAHWESKVTIDPQHFSRVLTGILIIINEDATSGDAQVIRAADGLVNALLSEGIFTQGPLSTPSGAGRIFKGLLDPPIQVVVGAKPDFPKEIS
jgi:hypothetical protein